MPQIYMGPPALLALWRKAYWGFFRPEKSDGFGRVWTRQHASSRRPKSNGKGRDWILYLLIFSRGRSRKRNGDRQIVCVHTHTCAHTKTKTHTHTHTYTQYVQFHFSRQFIGVKHFLRHNYETSIHMLFIPSPVSSKNSLPQSHGYCT
jgi:hypothetical protein